MKVNMNPDYYNKPFMNVSNWFQEQFIIIKEEREKNPKSNKSKRFATVFLNNRKINEISTNKQYSR